MDRQAIHVQGRVALSNANCAAENGSKVPVAEGPVLWPFTTFATRSTGLMSYQLSGYTGKTP
jgi:hypothetical protein